MTFTSCLLACCTLVSSPSHQWIPQDQEALETARTHCGGERACDARGHNCDNECLVKFNKIEDSIYEAICGRNNK